MSKVKFKNNRILVLTDTHFPYQHERTFDFLWDLRESFRPDRVVHVGDVVDFYGMSNYAKSPDHPDSFVSELEKIRQNIRLLALLFPKMRILMGNHDERFRRAASGAGIAASMLKPFSKVIGSPKGWRFYDDECQIRVESTGRKIMFAHHRGANVKLVASRLGQSVVTGHQHSKGYIDYFKQDNIPLFGAICPNLISNKGCPFKYAKLQDINPIQGAMLIEDGQPRIVTINGK
jgi:predicted phosphodiesterase